MKKNKWLAWLIVLLFPLVGYALVTYVAKPLNIPPQRFFFDSVVMTEHGVDTIWHRLRAEKFVNQFGDSVSLADLNGKVIILNTFFTSCPTICPALSKSMHALQESIVWKDARSPRKKETAPVQLISLSIDPERDQPDVLKKYAETYAANHDVWWFLTGNKQKIYDYILGELKLAVVDGENVDSNFIHSEKFILIDRHQIIRGYYHGLDSLSMKQLAKDAGLLILEKEHR